MQQIIGVVLIALFLVFVAWQPLDSYFRKKYDFHGWMIDGEADAIRAARENNLPTGLERRLEKVSAVMGMIVLAVTVAGALALFAGLAYVVLRHWNVV